MLTAYPVKGKAKSIKLCEAFVDGAPPDAKGAVFWGVNESNVADWHRVRAAGQDWYYGDNSFFDATRGDRFRWAKNAVQIRARDLTSDGRRFDELGLEIKPWRRGGDYWLVVQQSDSFMRTVAGDPDWLRREVASLGAGRPIVYRHWNRQKLGTAASLQRDIEGAWMVVCHTSAVAVQAVLNGAPAIVNDMHALARMVCGCGDQAHLDQRRQFLGVLADHEFTPDEMRKGEAWRRLHP